MTRPLTQPARPTSDSTQATGATGAWWRSLGPVRLPVVASSWAAGILALAPSLYMLEVYGRVVNARSATTLWMLSLLVVFAFAVMEVLEWLRDRYLHRHAQALDDVIAPRLFQSALNGRGAPQAAADSQSLQDWRTVRRFLNSSAIHGLIDAPVALVYLLAVFLISPWLGLLALVAAAIQVSVALATERATAPVLRQANIESVLSMRRADETVRHAEVLASMGMGPRLQGLWLQRQRRALDLQAQASARAGTSAAISRWWQNVVASALLGLGCLLLLNNDLHGGSAMMIVASILGGRVLAPLLQVVTHWSAVVAARQAWERIERLLDAPRPQGMPLPAPQGELSVENLVAGVPGLPGPPILKGLSLRLARGQVLAVAGPSASGKSTLARLLVGLWPATQGAVRLDGFDLHAWDRAEVGRHIGYLPQDVQLLPGTIADNLCRFGTATPDELAASAHRVGLHEAISALPLGYATPVDDASRLLSGGERQRLAIACALHGRPALVVLDEPNASLDEAGEAALAGVIREAKAQGTTFVVITHRPQILDVADLLLVLVDGQAQAFGPRDQVIAALAQRAKQPQAGARA